MAEGERKHKQTQESNTLNTHLKNTEESKVRRQPKHEADREIHAYIHKHTYHYITLLK